MNLGKFLLKCYYGVKMISQGVMFMATDKRQFTLRLSEENFEKIKYIASVNKRSIAMQIEYLIEQYIKQWEEEHGEISLDEIQS
jgi:hypothetical protein